MGDPALIALVGAISTVSIGVINALVAVKLHRKVDVVAEATNGLLAARDERNRAEGRAQQRADDKRKRK